MRTRYFLLALLILDLAALPASAQSTKNMLIQLQTQVQALTDQMARMQQSFDERMGVMRDLVEQSTDNVNKMGGSVRALEQTLQKQQSESGTNLGELSTQIQALHDSIDELKVRLANVTKKLEAMEVAQQNLPAAGAPPAGAAQAPPPDVIYNNALRDYNAGRYDVAMQNFQDYLKFYPTEDMAGNAQFYVADIYYRQGQFQQAVQEYDKVLERYAGGNKNPAAQLKKAYALIELGQRDAAIRELNSLVARYPRSQEATQAKDRLRRLRAAPTQSRQR
jgi:tol-pal system protein YbgF